MMRYGLYYVLMTMAMPEAFAPENAPKRSQPKTVEIRLDDLVGAIKSGDRASDVLESYERASPHLQEENRVELTKFLVEQEGCSSEFAGKFLGDKAFRRRVVNICSSFEQNGERLSRLEEAEIYTSLSDPSADDIGPMLKSVNLEKSFSNVRNISPEEMKSFQFKEVMDAIMDEENVPEAEAYRKTFGPILKKYGVSPKEWGKLFADPELLDKFLSEPDVQKSYNGATGGKDLNTLHRRIQLSWNEREDGTRTPHMAVMQMAKNPKTGDLSRLGFEIEAEPRINSKTGKPENRRVLKEVVIVTDPESRSSNAGINFLLDKLSLVKTYKLHEAESEADIKVGSYVWARMADMDEGATAKKHLSEEALKDIGPGPWDAAQTKEIRKQLFDQHIMPAYRKHIAEALATLPPEVRQANAATLQSQAEQFKELERKAADGVLTMEELANFGKGVDLFSFTQDGEVVSPTNPEARIKGHMGKAALMGIPWNFRVGLDRASLSRVVDKLNVGKPMTSLLMKAGLYLLH